MRAENFDIDDIIQHLSGTCMSDIADAISEICSEDFTIKYPNMTEEDLTEEDLNNIANFIFLCKSCGWWCETSEDNDYNGEQYCEQCYESVSEE